LGTRRRQAVTECNKAHLILLQQLGSEHEATVQVQKLLAELCQGEPWIQARVRWIQWKV
jgi:hypothetical protein